MHVPKWISRLLALTAFSVAFVPQASLAQHYPAPLDRIKEFAVMQGEKDNDGCYLWGKETEGVEFWAAHCLSDGSVAFGKGTPSGSYRWGIAYGQEGNYVFLEAVMGRVVTAIPVEPETAVEAADEFFREIEIFNRSPQESPAGGDQTVV